MNKHAIIASVWIHLLGCAPTPQGSHEAPRPKPLTIQPLPVNEPSANREPAVTAPAEAPIEDLEQKTDTTPHELNVVRREWDRLTAEWYPILLEREAKRRGFERVEHSLGTTVRLAIQNAEPLTKLKKTAFIIAGDDDIRVAQVLGKGKALALNEDGELAFLLTAPAERLYEGTSIGALSTAWRIRGVSSYTSFQGPKQAFTIEPIEPFEMEHAAEIEAAAALARDDGTVSFVAYNDDDLLECVEAPFKVAPKLANHDWAATKALCRDTFRVQPRAICTVKKNHVVTVHGYHVTLTEKECDALGGTLTVTSP